MATDIGSIIFFDILRMTQYPGSPFTGNIVNDLIMFLLVPSVFIILFTYSLLGRLFAAGQTRMRLLVGITIYLFIVAGGYYPAFALIAGPYFIVLIFLLGILYFVLGHFGVRRGHAMSGHALGHGVTIDSARDEFNMSELRADLVRAEEELDKARKAGSRGAEEVWGKEVMDLRKQIDALGKEHTNPRKYR